jgi:hypothetical protein
MRKLLTVAVAAVLFTVLTPQKANAQKYLGQTVVGANAGFSLVGAGFRAVFIAADQIVGLNTSVTPGISTSVDVGLSNRFSMGVAVFYQQANARFSSYIDPTDSVRYTGDFYFKAKRQNYAVRALFHFGDSDDFDPYFGIRLGMARWSFSDNLPTPFIDRDFFRKRVLPQALFGVRYFFLPFLGVNAEIAVGFPYYLSTGINFRFGGGM